MKTEYKGYTIQEEQDAWRVKYNDRFFFYPTADGIQHDADCDEEGFTYCGNCVWTATEQEAKETIDWLQNENE